MTESAELRIVVGSLLRPRGADLGAMLGACNEGVREELHTCAC
jgi:hypothetical protein